MVQNGLFFTRFEVEGSDNRFSRTSFWVAAKGSQSPDLAALPERTGETESLSNTVPSSLAGKLDFCKGQSIIECSSSWIGFRTGNTRFDGEASGT